MPAFRYTALNESNRICIGTVEAINAYYAIFKLYREGMRPYELLKLNHRDEEVFKRIQALKSQKRQLEISTSPNIVNKKKPKGRAIAWMIAGVILVIVCLLILLGWNIDL